VDAGDPRGDVEYSLPVRWSELAALFVPMMAWIADHAEEIVAGRP
jgi:DNA-binding HxlR family transcriptional regulator